MKQLGKQKGKCGILCFQRCRWTITSHTCLPRFLVLMPLAQVLRWQDVGVQFEQKKLFEQRKLTPNLTGANRVKYSCK